MVEDFLFLYIRYRYLCWVKWVILLISINLYLCEVGCCNCFCGDIRLGYLCGLGRIECVWMFLSKYCI